MKEVKKTITFRNAEVTPTFPYSVLLLLEEQYGINVFDREKFKASPKVLIMVLFAGLKTAFPDVTVEELLKAYSVKQIMGFHEITMEALAEAMPQDEEPSGETVS